MLIGVPREIKTDEYRVGIIRALTHDGCQVFGIECIDRQHQHIAVFDHFRTFRKTDALGGTDDNCFFAFQTEIHSTCLFIIYRGWKK